MEEADALGDWIAIMNEGKLLCYGTPMHLKKVYGKLLGFLVGSKFLKCGPDWPIFFGKPFRA